MNDYNNIIKKLDKLIDIQLEILLHLNNQQRPLVTKKEKSNTKEFKLAQPTTQELDYWLINRYFLKEKFNLVSAPQFDICMLYRETGDDSIFDRFKKKK